jgi:RecB family exonuclease
LIKAQSQCPFRGFAEYRLRARALEDASLGMDALTRGTKLHAALELVWRELKTSEKLQAMPPRELTCLVRNAICQAVQCDERGGLPTLLTAVERERLEALILEWLEVERTRVQPFSIESLEDKRTVDLAGLLVDVRLDRVDRLRSGRALLIDYKSGKQTKNKLQCPRPDEPQLLVYAATADDDVDGVILAQLQARDCRAAGFTREKQFDRRTVEIKGRDWDEFLEAAKKEVAALAGQFRSGWAAVDPRNGACEFCRLKPLCRVNENALAELDPE